MPPQKRRGGARQRRQFDSNNSDSDADADAGPGSADERSLEMEPSLSPEVHAKPLVRAAAPQQQLVPASSVQVKARETLSAERALHAYERLEDAPPASAPASSQLDAERDRGFERERERADRRGVQILNGPSNGNGHVLGGGLPTITYTSPTQALMAASAPPMLPPIRAVDEEPPSPPQAPPPAQASQPAPPPSQPAQRKRASTVTKGNRTSSNYGPKVVACNFCRGEPRLVSSITCIRAPLSSASPPLPPLFC